MADQEYENLTSQIKDLKQRLSSATNDPEEAREIGDTLQRLQRKASSYAASSSVLASSSAPVSPSQAVVNDPYMQEEEEEEGANDEAVNVAESAATAASEKAKSERDELSDRAREHLLQVSQAPEVGPSILPSGKPGVDYAQQMMIRQLQTTLAPAFILDRLEKKPTPVSQSKPEKSEKTEKPKPQARQKIKVTFRKKDDGEGQDQDQLEASA